MKIFTTLKMKSLVSVVALVLFSIAASAQPTCDPPTGPVTITNVTSTSFNVSWGASPSEVSGGRYLWEVRENGVGGSGQSGLEANGFTDNGILTISVPNLNFDTTYIVYVSYECGDAEFTSVWIASAATATNTIQAPVTTPATAVLDVSMRVNWLAVAGASNYLLDVSTDPDFNTFFGVYEDFYTTTNYADLTGLTPNETYYWRVRAQGTGGLGFETSAYSNVTSRQTLGAQEGWVTWVAPGEWSPNVSEGPDFTKDAVIAFDYNTETHGSFIAKNLIINNGVTLTITGGESVNLTGFVANLNEDNEGLILHNEGFLNQSHMGVNGNTGGAKVQRASAEIYRLDYTIWSSPTSGDGNVVNGQTLLQFSPETVPTRFYDYQTTTNFFVPISANSQFQPAKGYLIRAPNNHPSYNVASPVPGTNWTGQFQGVPNSGDYSYALDTSGTKFNMIGNPYPSKLSLEDFLEVNTNIEGTIYLWRRKNAQNDDSTTQAYYATYTSAGGTSTGAPSDSSDPNNLPDGFAQVGQGFIVQATATTTAPAEVVFTNAMRSAENPFSPFFRGSATAATPVEKDRFWLNLGSAGEINNQMLIAYLPTSQNGVDRADGKSFGESSISLTSYLDGQEYAIQGRATFEDTDIVPLNFRTATAGSYTITLHDVEGVFEDGQDIFLRDNVTAAVHDLNSGDYTFASEAGNFNNRFEILYANPLSVANPVFDANGVIAIKQGGNIVVNAGNITIASVKVFDIRGSLIAEKNNVNASEVSINAGTTKQVLIVQVTSDDNRTVSKKVIN